MISSKSIIRSIQNKDKTNIAPPISHNVWLNRLKWHYSASRVMWRDLVINKIAASYICPKKLRILIYKYVGIQVGENANINPHCFLGSSELEIGDDVFINYLCFFDGSDKIKIGNNVRIGMRCTFITSNHELGTSSQRAGASTHSPIVIEHGCWIGGNVTILPGVRIGMGSVIGAGSLVAKDCLPNSLYVGVPAKRIKGLEGKD